MRKYDLKTCIAAPVSRFFVLPFYLLTWDDIVLCYGLQTLEIILRSASSTLFIPIYWLRLRLTYIFCSLTPSGPNSLTFWLWPDLWRQQWPPGQISHLFWKFMYRAIELRLNFGNQTSSLEDHRGGDTPPPPSTPTKCATCQTPMERHLTQQTIYHDKRNTNLHRKIS